MTDIHLIVSDHTIHFNFKDEYAGVDIRIQSQDGKPKYRKFDLMSDLNNLAKKEYMDNIINKSNKDLQVYMQKEFNINDPESPSSHSIKESSVKGK